MNGVKLCLAVLVGFILGACLWHHTPVRAGTGLYIKKVSEGYNPDGELAARTIVGFSCVKGDKSGLDACYVAATQK
jgi:hypothetical protein